MRKSELKYIPIEELRLNPRNSNKHPESQISQLVELYNEYGFVGALVVDETYTLLAGEGRLTALRRWGQLELVPCYVVSGLSDRQKRAFLIADNQAANNSEFDLEKLSEEIDYLVQAGYENIDLLGFDEQELEDLLKGVEDFLPSASGAIPLGKVGEVEVRENTQQTDTERTAEKIAVQVFFRSQDEAGDFILASGLSVIKQSRSVITCEHG